MRLVEARAQLGEFETLGFPGHAVTGAEMTRAIEQALHRKLKVGSMPWPLLRTLGIVIPTYRELAEMAYLWQVPHRIDGRKLEAAIGTIPHTPFETAIMDTLEGFDLLKKRA